MSSATGASRPGQRLAVAVDSRPRDRHLYHEGQLASAVSTSGPIPPAASGAGFAALWTRCHLPRIAGDDAGGWPGLLRLRRVLRRSLRRENQKLRSGRISPGRPPGTRSRHPRWRYFAGETTEQVNPSKYLAGTSYFPPLAHIPAYSYFDLSATFNIYKNVRLELGVNNIADNVPPIVTLADCSTGSAEGAGGTARQHLPGGSMTRWGAIRRLHYGAVLTRRRSPMRMARA